MVLSCNPISSHYIHSPTRATQTASWPLAATFLPRISQSPEELASPVFLGSISAVTCHFVSMVSALSRSATLAASPRLSADRGTANLCDSMCHGSILPVPRDSSWCELQCSGSRVKVSAPERLGRWQKCPNSAETK